MTIHAGGIEAGMHPHRGVELRQLRARGFTEIRQYRFRIVNKRPRARFNMIPRERQPIEHQFRVEPGVECAPQFGA